MTHYAIRTDLSAQPPADPEIRLLDWSPDSSAATIHVGNGGADFFEGWRPPRAASDLLVFASAVYSVDKTALRDESDDRWTRDLAVDVPVLSPPGWTDSGIEQTLNFLSGDRWQLAFARAAGDPLAGIPRVPDDVTPVADVSAVSLFSGGLDSLIGTVDFLEAHPDQSILLVSHTEGGQTSPAQDRLVPALRQQYGNDRVRWRRIYVRPAPPDTHQVRPLSSERENTTRTRSLLFLSLAAALASSIGPDVPVVVPENGFIGINVPLTRARSGSFSTRTTHPYFIKSLAAAFRSIGIENPIQNPYRLLTKGQMLEQARNSELLRELAPLSVSCSHPEAARWVQRPQGNCGYCFPCLIRRASMARVGWDSSTDYAWDALSGAGLLDADTDRNRDLRAVLNGVYTGRPDREVLRNGPIPDGEQADFVRVWRAGLAELRAWLDGATGRTKAAFEAIP